MEKEEKFERDDINSFAGRIIFNKSL